MLILHFSFNVLNMDVLHMVETFHSYTCSPEGKLCCFLPGCVSIKSKEMGPF